MPARLLAALRSKKETFTRIQKHKVLRQARFFRWLRFHHSRSRARFPGGQPGETGHGNSFGGVSPPPSAVSAWKPRDPRFPGVLCPSTAGCRVVDLPAVSAPLLSWKPAACSPSFFTSKIVRHPAALMLLWPDVARGEEPPCCCDLVSLYQLRADLLYTNPEKIISLLLNINSGFRTMEQEGNPLYRLE